MIKRQEEAEQKENWDCRVLGVCHYPVMGSGREGLTWKLAVSHLPMSWFCLSPPSLRHRAVSHFKGLTPDFAASPLNNQLLKG